ncbi:hypothetical protein MHBO_002959 [Bonamia ostreae]|uniref:Mitochondrial carrier protein n=1 Tax=Bonamia ostreae TaxID=126728 RepID=A0ABV2APU8_9EUKA
MPIDASKTSLQVHGKDGFRKLIQKVKTARSPSVLYHGALAAYSATLVGHFPWFFTFNTLDKHLPKRDDNIWYKLARRALMGFVSSVISDSISNSIRVIKTFKQTSPVPITYPNAVKTVYAKSGLVGLFGRGLKIRIATNGTQGLLFAILWKGIMDIVLKEKPAKV